MRLTFAGTSGVAAPREAVWAKLLDPEAVAAAAPGVESVTLVDERHYQVICAFGVGAVTARFRLQVELSDLAEPERVRMRAHGTASGSVADVRTRVDLAEDGPGRTRLDWTAEATVGGTIASVGARLFEGTTRKIMENFWADFAAGAASDRP